jgi:hypothetical protein
LTNGSARYILLSDKQFTSNEDTDMLNTQLTITYTYWKQSKEHEWSIFDGAELVESGYATRRMDAETAAEMARAEHVANRTRLNAGSEHAAFLALRRQHASETARWTLGQVAA